MGVRTSLNNGNQRDAGRIVECILDKWKVGLWGGEALRSTSGGKLVLYRQFKTTPELEPYARAGVPLAARRILAGLWAGCLPLQSELGRFTCPKTP